MLRKEQSNRIWNHCEQDTPYSISLMQMLLPTYTWCWDLWAAPYSSWVRLVAMNVHLSTGRIGERRNYFAEVYSWNLLSSLLPPTKVLPKYQLFFINIQFLFSFSISQLLSSLPPTYCQAFRSSCFYSLKVGF